MKFLAATAIFALVLGTQSGIESKDIRVATLTDCGGNPDPAVTFNGAVLTPDPVQYPGVLGIDMDLTVNRELGPGVQIDLSMTKQGFIPIDLPCIDGLGACTFDLCEAVTNNQETFCQVLPTDSNGNCSCPIAPGNYVSSGPIQMELPDMGAIIGALIYGKYNGYIEVLDAGNAQIGCLFMKDVEIK